MTDKLSPNMRVTIAAAVAIVILLLLLASCGGDEEESAAGSNGSTEVAVTTTTDVTPVDPDAEQRVEARAAERAEDYDDAVQIYVDLHDSDSANRVRRVAASTLLDRARAAYSDGRFKTAERQARAAIRRYGVANAKGAKTIRNRAAAKRRLSEARARARVEARKVAQGQAREQRRIEREQARAAAEAAEAAAEAESYESYDEPSYDAPSSGGRAGCNPATARDGDGDGIVCE